MDDSFAVWSIQYDQKLCYQILDSANYSFVAD